MWKTVNATSPRPVSATVIFAPTLESRNAQTNGTAPRLEVLSGDPFGWRTRVVDGICGAHPGAGSGDGYRYSSAADRTGDAICRCAITPY